MNIVTSHTFRSGDTITIRPAKNNSKWLEKNRQALDSSNAYVEAKGLPLAKYHRF